MFFDGYSLLIINALKNTKNNPILAIKTRKMGLSGFPI